MEKIPWYRSAIIRQQIVMVVIGILGLLKLQTDVDIDATVTAVFAGIAALVPVWTIITRMTKAHPPLTDKAAVKEERVQEQLRAVNLPVSKESGRARTSTLVLLVLCAVPGAVVVGSALQGCVTAPNPVAHAETVEQKAYALYGTFVVVEEVAAKLYLAPDVPQSVKDALRATDAAAKPVADALFDAAEEVLRIKLEIDAGVTTQDKLVLAITNLDRFISEASPKIKALSAALKEAR